MYEIARFTSSHPEVFLQIGARKMYAKFRTTFFATLRAVGMLK